MTNAAVPQNVIVGFDGQSRSEGAARRALDFHQRFGSRVELVHAIDVPRPEDLPGPPAQISETYADLESRTWERLQGRVAELLSECGVEGLTPDACLRISIGHPAQVVVERAEELGADLIVLGPHEKHGIFDFGSTARAILAKAPHAVWIEPGELRPIERILVPTDLSADSRIALEIAVALAGKLGARVTALHAFVPPEFAYPAAAGYPAISPGYVVEGAKEATEEEFRRELNGFDWGDVEHELLFIEDRPLSAILGAQSDFDLIAMGSHGRTGLASAVLGNVAYGVLKEAEIPVLAIRHPERSWLL